MKPIAIHADSRAFGTCRSCGARVEWATLETSSRRMPFNPPIVIVPSLIEAPGIVDVDMDRTRSHFAACQHASAWRKFR